MDANKAFPEPTFREADVRATYRFLGHLAQTEIRLIDLKRKIPPQSVFVSNEEDFIKACKKHNSKYNIYAGINERRNGGTKSEDVVRVKTVVIDIDAARPDHDQPATDGELAVAEKAARQIISMFGAYGNPAMALSGNGYQLWYSIPVQDVNDGNRKELDAKFQAFQREVIKAAEGLGANVDNIGDLPRIIKVIGTLSVKGDSTVERHHRCSKWLIGAPVRKDSTQLLSHILELKASSEIQPIVSGGNLDDTTLKSIFENDSKVRMLMEGKHEEMGYQDRSQPEQALMIRLIRYGLSKEQIWQMMGSCKIGKWNERADGDYRQSSYENALKWLQENEPGALIAPISNFNIRPASELMEKYKGWKPVWIVDKLIPEGALVIWVGRQASFKSWLITSLACAVAKGSDWLDKFTTTKTNVLIIDAENSPVLLSDRLTKSGCNGGVYYYAGENFSFEKDTESVIEQCHKLGIKIVILDTLRRGHGFDENSAEEINRLFKDYLFKFKLSGITLISLYHTKKQQQGAMLINENDLIRGSGEFGNLPDVVIFNTRHGVTPIVNVKQTKCRFAHEIEGFNVSVAIDEKKAVFSLIAEEGPVTIPSMLAEKFRRYLETLMRGEILPIDAFRKIAIELGVKSDETMHKAVRMCVANGDIEKVGKGIYKVLSLGQQKLDSVD